MIFALPDEVSGSMPNPPVNIPNLDALIGKALDGTVVFFPKGSSIFPSFAALDAVEDLDTPFVIRITDGE